MIVTKKVRVCDVEGCEREIHGTTLQIAIDEVRYDACEEHWEKIENSNGKDLPKMKPGTGYRT